VNHKIASGVVGYESLVDWLNKVCKVSVGEGKLIFGLNSRPGVRAGDNLLCFAHVYVKSLVYGV